MKKLLLLAVFTAISAGLWAQTKPSESKTAADSLLNSMSGTEKAEPVIATFKSTRLILGATSETVKKNNLNFMVIHRFGDLAGSQGGGKTFFGLDNSSDIYIGFEYGLSNNLEIDLGRSKFNQQIDLGLKYALLHQTSDNSLPFAITLLGKSGLKAYHADQGEFPTFADRFVYVGQAIFARKFSTNFSMQVSPTFVRNNSPFPFLPGNNRSFFALGAAARLKVTKRLGIVVDYAHPFSSFRQNANGENAFYDPLGVGLEIETGGHVFTIVFSNAKAITESSILSASQSDWGKGQFRLGFTISRMFSFAGKNKNAYK